MANLFIVPMLLKKRLESFTSRLESVKIDTKTTATQFAVIFIVFRWPNLIGRSFQLIARAEVEDRVLNARG